MAQGWKVSNEFELYNLVAFLKEQIALGRSTRVEIVNRLTPAQFNAIHSFCDKLARTLNDSGFSVMAILKHDAEIPWSGALVKEHIWKPIQKAMTDRESTHDISRVDVSAIYDTIARHLAQSKGIVVPPFPDKHNPPEDT